MAARPIWWAMGVGSKAAMGMGKCMGGAGPPARGGEVGGGLGQGDGDSNRGERIVGE